jgi:hypothetical protein
MGVMSVAVVDKEGVRQVVRIKEPFTLPTSSKQEVGASKKGA